MNLNEDTKSLLERCAEIQSASRLPQPTLLTELPRRAMMGLLGTIGGGLALGLSRAVRAESCAVATRQPIQGPYYLGDPEEKYDTGSGLIVKGNVVDAVTCQPIVGAIIVRWHANDAGFYEEFYRALMLTKSDGTFEMSSITPGQYAGLARHIHWYVAAAGYKSTIDQIQWNDDVVIEGTETFNFSLTRE